MGTIQHHCFIATTWDDTRFSAVEAAVANRSDSEFFILVPERVNGYKSVIVPPDGSKEGWEASNKGNDRRDWLLGLLDDWWYWVEVSFGELGTELTRRRRENRDYL